MLFAVQRALNLELASVRDACRNNPATTKFRYMFWRELVNGAFSVGRRVPLVPPSPVLSVFPFVPARTRPRSRIPIPSRTILSLLCKSTSTPSDGSPA